MTETSVDDFLNAPLGSVEKPAMLPPGTYLGNITKHEKREVKIQDKTVPRIQFTVKVTMAEADVDEDMLAKVNLSTMFVYPEFDLDEKGRYRLQQFLVGLFPDSEGAKISEFLAATVGKQVVFKVAHRPGKQPGADGEIPMYLNISGLKSAE